MNPEFERNVWLELTPLRLIVMGAVLALAFFAAALSQGLVSPGGVARWLYFFMVVIWGTHNAARAVLGEIRDRTWDGQRLSSLGAGTMMWGKLFGATVFNWFGGLICLAVIASETVMDLGALAALEQVVYWLAVGVIAQGTSLLASLIAVRRRQGRSSFELFLYQLAGLAAAIAVWAFAYPNGPNIGYFGWGEDLPWWDFKLPKTGFFLVSLALFTGWMLTGCYRQMRLELKLVNGPWVWLAFLAFAAIYVAGFGQCVQARADAVTCRLALAAIAMAALAYVTVLLEPKSRVLLRWLGGEFAGLRLGAFFGHLQGWMMSYLAAVVLTVAMLIHLALAGAAGDVATTGAILGLFTRDIGLVLLMNLLARGRGGDLIALALFVVLYALLPSIIAGLHVEGGVALFLPHRTDPMWLAPALAWIEAVVVWAFAASRIALPDKN
jgi:hypothetical protein